MNKYLKQFSKSILIFMVSMATNNAVSQTTATPKQMVEALHETFGKHPNARAVHAKGIILEGTFKPSPEAKKITIAKHFQNQISKITVRFSDFTGIPTIPDTVGLSNPRGLAIKFHLPDNSTSDIISHSYNGFPVATTDDFVKLLHAVATSGNEAKHPNNLENFFQSHPIAKIFLTSQKPASTSYSTLNYYGVNSFKFTNEKGISKYIRYQFIPVSGEHFLSTEELKNSSPNYLSEEIINRIKSNTLVKFKLYAQIAEQGDEIKNPSIAWSDKNKLIYLGLISINKVSDNSIEADKNVSFVPNNIPAGIEIADPMLQDRSKAYPISVKERQ